MDNLFCDISDPWRMFSIFWIGTSFLIFLIFGLSPWYVDTITDSRVKFLYILLHVWAELPQNPNRRASQVKRTVPARTDHLLPNSNFLPPIPLSRPLPPPHLARPPVRRALLVRLLHRPLHTRMLLTAPLTVRNSALLPRPPVRLHLPLVLNNEVLPLVRRLHPKSLTLNLLRKLLVSTSTLLFLNNLLGLIVFLLFVCSYYSYCFLSYCCLQ